MGCKPLINGLLAVESFGVTLDTGACSNKKSFYLTRASVEFSFFVETRPKSNMKFRNVLSLCPILTVSRHRIAKTILNHANNGHKFFISLENSCAKRLISFALFEMISGNNVVISIG